MAEQKEKVEGKSRRVKQKKIQTGDGWTVVTHTSRQGAAGKKDEGMLRDARVTKTVDGLTVPKLLDDFKTLQTRWMETSCANTVRHILGNKQWGVKEALCIGIGSFSLDWEHRHRSMWQLVLFMDVVNILSNDEASPRLYAQEPIFAPLDEAFLSALNITVVSSGVESHVTNSSFIFAPFVDWNLLLPVFLKGKNPELYVGNSVLDDYSVYASTEEKRKVLKECNQLGKTFLEGRSETRVPEFGLHAHALNGLVACWKKAVEGEGT